MKKIEPSHRVCPASKDGYTHHLRPRYTGKAQYVLACEYCKKTDAEIRKGDTNE